MKRPAGDEITYTESGIEAVGVVTTWGERDPADKPLPREFPPGFHGAAPGPSQEAQKTKRRR